MMAATPDRADALVIMLWLYSDDDVLVRIETHYNRIAGIYTLVVHRPAAPPTTDQFVTAASFRLRLQELEQELDRQGLKICGPPVLLPSEVTSTH